MNIQEIVNNSGNTSDLERIMSIKKDKLTKTFENLDLLLEVLKVQPNRYLFQEIVLSIDTHFNINIADTFASDYNYLLSLKVYEELYLKKKEEELTPFENEKYMSAKSDILLMLFPEFKGDEEPSPEVIRKSNTVLSKLIKINDKLKEIHDASSIYAVFMYIDNYKSDKNGLILSTFKNINFANLNEANLEVEASYNKMSEKHEEEIMISDQDIVDAIGGNVLVNIFIKGDIENKLSFKSVDFNEKNIPKLDLMKFFIKKGLYLAEIGKKQDFFSKNLFDIFLIEDNKYEKDNDEVDLKINRLMKNAEQIRFKCSSIKKIDPERIKELFLEVIKNECDQYIKAVKEDRTYSNYIENLSTLLSRFFVLASRGSEKFKDNYKEIIGCSYFVKGNMEESFKESKHNPYK